MHIIDERVFRTMKFHVFAENVAVATCVHPEDAAALVALYGPGACITDPNSSILWSEGEEDQPAAESYDHVAEVVLKRLEKTPTRTHKRSPKAAV